MTPTRRLPRAKKIEDAQSTSFWDQVRALEAGGAVLVKGIRRRRTRDELRLERQRRLDRERLERAVIGFLGEHPRASVAAIARGLGEPADDVEDRVVALLDSARVAVRTRDGIQRFTCRVGEPTEQEIAAARRRARRRHRKALLAMEPLYWGMGSLRWGQRRDG